MKFSSFPTLKNHYVENIFSFFNELKFWIVSILTGNVAQLWNNRKVSCLCFNILLKKELSSDDLLNLKDALVQVQNPDTVLHFFESWKQDSKSVSYQDFEKILRSLSFLKTLSMEEDKKLKHELQALVNTPHELLKSNLKVRAYCLSLHSLHSGHQKFDLEEAILKYGLDLQTLEQANHITTKIRSSFKWNNRQILFHTRPSEKSSGSDQLCWADKVLNYLGLNLLHAGHIRPLAHDPGMFHITYIDKKLDKISTKDLLTSFILELDVQYLLLQKSDNHLKIDDLNNRLAYFIDREFKKVDLYELKNSHWTRFKSIYYFFIKDSQKNRYELQNKQSVQCCHFVACNLFNAVESLNSQLELEMNSSKRVLKQLFPDSLNPRGIFPTTLPTLLQPNCHVISNL